MAMKDAPAVRRVRAGVLKSEVGKLPPPLKRVVTTVYDPDGVTPFQRKKKK